LRIRRGHISLVTDRCGSEGGGEEIRGEEERIYFINIDLEVDDIDGEEETGEDHGSYYDDDADNGKTGHSHQGNSNYDLLRTLEEGGRPTYPCRRRARRRREAGGRLMATGALALVGDPGQV
jgi:hypothetical protein